MKKIILIIFLAMQGSAFANDSLIISQLLKRVQHLQPGRHGVFPKGSIPSYRMYALNKTRYKADINAFYTGLVVFTLRDVMPELSAAEQRQAQAIIRNAVPTFSKFAHRKGLPLYNFWPVDTPQIFPHSGWMNWFLKNRAPLPYDMDDTAILLMAEQASDSTAQYVHKLMQGYTNNPNKKINNTFKDYQDIRAYSTWFGKKMPVDFDVCVLANVLYFVQYYNLTWTAADSASLYLIEKVIQDKKHIRAAAYVSPHYAKLPSILYHISRLMSLKTIPSLEKLKPQLIEDARQALASAKTFVDEVILSTSLLRWGITPPDTKPRKANGWEEQVEDEQFSFFIASMASMLSNPIKQWVSGIGLGTFYYYCPAYNNVLLLENLIWRKRRGL